MSVDLKPSKEQEFSIFLSSDEAELYANINGFITEGKGKDKKQVAKSGVGFCRSHGYGIRPRLTNWGLTDGFGVYDATLKVDERKNVTMVGHKNGVDLFVDGEKVGYYRNQVACPLMWLGSAHGESFIGEMFNLEIYNKAFSQEEITEYLEER